MSEKDIVQKELEKLEKTQIGALSLGIDNILTPAASRQYFNNVVDVSSFLGSVSSVQVDAIEQDLDLFALNDRSLVRIPEGSEPTDGQKAGASNLGKRWYLKPVQLFVDVNFSTIINRKKQGDIESYLASLFSKAFQNDLLLLGLEGDENAADDFKKLNDGWIQLASASLNGTDRKITNIKDNRTVIYHGATDTRAFEPAEAVSGVTSGFNAVVSVVGNGYIEVVALTGTPENGEQIEGTNGATPPKAIITMTEQKDIQRRVTMNQMLKVMPDKYKNTDKLAFIMSVSDSEAWGEEMGLFQGLNPYLVSGAPPKHKGYRVIGVPGCPVGKFLLTDPKNLAFGMSRVIKRDRNLHSRRRCVEYTWDLYSDYLIVNDEAVVYSE